MVTVCYTPARIGVYPYESPLDGTSDDSPAVIRAVNDILSGDCRSSILQWSGPMTLAAPLPTLDRITFEGDDMMGATVRKAFSGGVLFNFGGRVGYTGGGLVNFSVPTQPTTAGSYIFMSRARADGYAADSLRLERLYLSSGGVPANQPFRNIEIVGSARRSPLGQREMTIRDVTCFGSTGGEMFDTLVGATVDNLQIFPAPLSGGGAWFQNCDSSSFDSLNVQVPINRSGNVYCSFRNKAGIAF